MITLRLPIPPSVNALYANGRNKTGKGRFKTRAYKEWLADADACFMAQGVGRRRAEIRGPAEISIRVPKIRGDISNRIKAAEDYLVSRGVTGDDRFNRKVSIEVDENLTGTFCEVTVTPVAGE